jgi:hypothetical protein
MRAWRPMGIFLALWLAQGCVALKHDPPAGKCDPPFLPDCPPPPCAEPAKICPPPPPHVEVQQAVMQPMALPQPTMAAQPQGLTSEANVHYSLAGRARPALAFDFVRIPFPILRLVAVPTTPEVTVPMAAQALTVAPQALVQPQAFVQPQALVQPQAVVQAPPVVQPQAIVQPQAQAVPVQGTVDVPVQGSVKVPVEGHAIVQGQGVSPQGLIVSPQSITVTPQAAPATPDAITLGLLSPQALQSADPQVVAQFYQRVDALKAACDRQRGVLLPPICPGNR